MYILLLLFVLCVDMLALQARDAAPVGHFYDYHGSRTDYVTGHSTDHGLLQNMMLQCALDRSMLVGLTHACMQDVDALRTELASLHKRHQDLQKGHQRLAHQHAELLRGLVNREQEHESLRAAFHRSEAANQHLVMENGYLLSRLHETSHQLATLDKERDTARPTLTITLNVHNIVQTTNACHAVAKIGAQDEADRMKQQQYTTAMLQKENIDLQEEIEALKEEREHRKLVYDNMLTTYADERRQNEKRANQVITLLKEQERLLNELDNNRQEQKEELVQPRQETDYALVNYAVWEEELVRYDEIVPPKEHQEEKIVSPAEHQEENYMCPNYVNIINNTTAVEIVDTMKKAHELEDEVKPDDHPETLDNLTVVQVLEEVEITVYGTAAEEEDVLKEECKSEEADTANSLQQHQEHLPEDDEESQCSMDDYESTGSDSFYYYQLYEHPEVEASQKPLKDTTKGAQEIFRGYDMTKQKRKHLVN